MRSLLPASTVAALLEHDPELDKRSKNQHPPAVTREKQKQFLLNLARSGQHAKSCALAGISINVPWLWADKSDVFAKKFQLAKEAGEKVLLAAYEQDLDAVVAEPACLPYTSNLRMFRMKRLDPRYRDSQAAVQVNVGPAAIVLGVEDEPPKQIEQSGTT